MRTFIAISSAHRRSRLGLGGDSAIFIKDLIQIPERVQRGDCVLNLASGLKAEAIDQTLKDYGAMAAAPGAQSGSKKASARPAAIALRRQGS